MTLVDNWQAAAARIGFADALSPWQELTRAQYESLHDNGVAEGLDDPGSGFLVDSVGGTSNPAFNDEGIEYYRFLG